MAGGNVKNKDKLAHLLHQEPPRVSWKALSLTSLVVRQGWRAGVSVLTPLKKKRKSQHIKCSERSRGGEMGWSCFFQSTNIPQHVCGCVSGSVLSDTRTVPTRLLCPWDSPDKNPGVGSHALVWGIFLTQGPNPG